MKLHVTHFSPASCCFLLLRPKYLSQHPTFDHLQPMFSLMLEIKFLTTENMQNYSSVHVTLILGLYLANGKTKDSERVAARTHVLHNLRG